MYTIITKVDKLPNGMKMITKYKPEEIFFISIIKFLFYLFLVWPLQIAIIFWIFIFKLILKILLFITITIIKIVTLPFKIIFGIK